LPGGRQLRRAVQLAIFQRKKLLLRRNNDVAMPRSGRARRSWSAMLKKLNQMPVLKYSLIAVAALLWLVGLSDQLPDLMQTAKYVGISLLLVAVAVI
jgi:hypothetical protein